ncbi:FERM and PDZ domain-containing protein 4 isoform X1 [Onthophagus taurus]|uniref:FERM and PDZ domain-containing protein 4 isoform X1 n=1 Tax=Onthophagus taurus TaxID=166361 RepID=UPI0039BDD748
MLLQAQPNDSSSKLEDYPNIQRQQNAAESHTHMLDYAPAPGWTVHSTKEGRLYYCNHVTKTAGWLPPVEAWKNGEDLLPYGWERAVDDSGRPYYINHVNKTTTYETPAVRNLEPTVEPEPRCVVLERSPALGFGFVAGSEKPVIVRFVTEGGPSVDKLLPGDQIWEVNGEDVKKAPREHVIQLVRACSSTVKLVVCQPPEQHGARKSTLLSASKRARLKSKPSRVRFAESVCVNGAPLFPPSAFSLGDLCVPPMANVLKVFLENGQTKSFKYDAWTTVHDVVTSLQTKLCLTATEHFSLVVEHIKSLKRNKLTLLDPSDSLARIASRPGAHKLRCLYRIAFVPTSAADLAQQDLAALDYLFTQCCNDVIQERFAPELHYDTALRLAALHIYQHALANNMAASKLNVKIVEREFGLERFVPASLLEKMKRKEVKKVVGHFLKLHSNMAGSGKHLTPLQAKLHYLDIVSQLPSYGAKCFSAGPKADTMERVILVSPKFGISQITGTRNSVPTPIANIEDMKCCEVRSEDEVFRSVLIRLKNDQTIQISLEERDANELVLVLKGYYRLLTGEQLNVEKEQTPPIEDLAPPYLAQHKIIPEKWSYINQNQMRTMCFASSPHYQTINKKTNGLYNTMGRSNKHLSNIGLSLDNNMNSNISNRNHCGNKESCKSSLSGNSYDLHSVVSMEILESGVLHEAKNEEIIKRVQEMQQLVENSEKYLTEQEQLERLNFSAEWQESSVDIESDTDSIFDESTLKHSDSLLLLTKGCTENNKIFTNAAIEMLRSELNASESDNDSLYTPNNSPKHKNLPMINNNSKKISRISFGLHSPDNPIGDSQDLKTYLLQLKEKTTSDEQDIEDNISDLYVFDPDIIDLTFLPPPATPDELDSIDIQDTTTINIPPSSFADSVEKLNKLGVLHENLDLEEFLASVTVPPPTQKVTPAVELTPEEIMSYIIPPPPLSKNSIENLTLSSNYDTPPRRRNSISSSNENVIEYATVDRKGAFSCCSKTKEKNIENKDIQPPPRRSSNETPPARPPKNINSQERQRSHSLTSHLPKEISFSNAPFSETTFGEDSPPKLPPKGEINSQAPPHLFLPPKKPPLPPVPPLETIRSRKGAAPPPKTEGRTAGIGSPHLQRNRNVYNDIESKFGEDKTRLNHCSTAVSTPTSPYLGRGAQMTVAPPPLDSPEYNNEIPTPPPPPTCSMHHARSLSDSRMPSPRLFCKSPRCKDKFEHAKQLLNGTPSNSPVKNGCVSNRENLLSKTDVAMASLLVRLDQVAAQCNAAQIHGGGKYMCEEKFQIAKDELTTQSLQLVHSSKMLVIAMSNPNLPDLPENLAVCLTILRRLTELCQDLSNHTTAPLQTRNLILKVHDVTSAFRHLISSNIDRSSQSKIEEHLAAEAESLANVLTTLLRSLRVFSP